MSDQPQNTTPTHGGAPGVAFALRRPVRGRDVAEELADAVTGSRADLLGRAAPAQRILLDVECPILAVTSAPGE